MDTLNNIYMITTITEKRHIPNEIVKMYEDEYGHRPMKKFFRSLRK